MKLLIPILFIAFTVFLHAQDSIVCRQMNLNFLD